MRLSVHVADCVSGEWHKVAAGKTDQDGSLREWHDDELPAGTYRIDADLDRYYTDLGIVPFIPRLIVDFRITDPASDLLIPMVITGSSQLVYRSTQLPPGRPTGR